MPTKNRTLPVNRAMSLPLSPSSARRVHARSVADQARVAWRSRLGVAAGLAVSFLWSGVIVVARWGVQHDLTIWDITLLRFTAAAAVTAPLLYRLRGNLRGVFNAKVVVCALGCGFPFTLANFEGLISSPAANAGVIVNGLFPPLVAILALLWMKERLTKAKLIGISTIVVANALILFGGGGSTNVAGAFWLLTAALILAIYAVSMRVWSISLDVLLVAIPWINAVIFLPIWLAMPTAMGGATTREILLQVVYQGVVICVVAQFLMSYAFQSLGSVTASTFMALVPALTAIFGVVVLGEALNACSVLGVALCSLGMLAYHLPIVRVRRVQTAKPPHLCFGVRGDD